jgi:hypothetical protein
MLKKIMSALVGCAIATSAFASRPSNDELELTADYRLYKDNPTEYYKNHPAVKDNNNRSGFEAAKREVVFSIAMRLDLDSMGKFFRVNKFVNNQRTNLLMARVIDVYRTCDLDFDKAFARSDHPDWKPWHFSDDPAVQNAMTIKLHYNWFYQAMKMHVSATPDEERKPEDVMRQFRLFYQAGCLGHMLAAEQAGLMLFEPKFNHIIPAVIPYDMLEPEAETWDVRRLNREIMTDKFKTIFDRLHAITKAAGNPPNQALFHELKPQFETALKMLAEGYLENDNERQALELYAKRALMEYDYDVQYVQAEAEGRRDDIGDSEGWDDEQIEFLESIDFRSTANLEYLRFLCALFKVGELDDSEERAKETDIIFSASKLPLNYKTLRNTGFEYIRPAFERDPVVVIRLFEQGGFQQYSECLSVACLLGSKGFNECRTWLLEGLVYSDQVLELKNIVTRHCVHEKSVRLFFAYLSVTRNQSDGYMLHDKVLFTGPCISNLEREKMHKKDGDDSDSE